MNRQKLHQFLLVLGLAGLTAAVIFTVIKIRERVSLVPKAVEPPTSPQCTVSFTLDDSTPTPTSILVSTSPVPGGKCPVHPDSPDYRVLQTVEGKPVTGYPAQILQLPLPQTFTFALTVRNTGSTPFAATYTGNFNKCTADDLTKNPWKCTGPAVSTQFPAQQTDLVPAGGTKTFAFGVAGLVCNQRYQYDIYIPGGLTNNVCGPDMAGLIEFVCITPTVTAAPTVTLQPTPTVTRSPTGSPTPPLSSTPTTTTAPTVTPLPSPTPRPSATPVPTATPRPTSTPRPTITPIPTRTPTPVLVASGPSATPIPVPRLPQPGAVTPTLIIAGTAVGILLIGILALLL